VSEAFSNTDLRDLLKKLNRAALKPAEVRQALEIAAGPLADQLKFAAPMQIIRDDIGVISKPFKYPKSIMVGLRYRKGAISNLGYAFEYGTVDRYTKKKEFRGKLTPRPWFRPTVDSMRSKIVTDMRNELAKIVQNKLKK
jgi:hypothetical protein